jgi:hypothetical protein
VSRRGHVFKSWPHLSDELLRDVRCSNALLDGEICCLASAGRAEFYNLLFRRGRSHFMAFAVIWLDAQDLRDCPLHERKRLLRGILPTRIGFQTAFGSATTMTRDESYSPFGGRRGGEPPSPILVQRLWRAQKPSSLSVLSCGLYLHRRRRRAISRATRSRTRRASSARSTPSAIGGSFRTC